MTETPLSENERAVYEMLLALVRSLVDRPDDVVLSALDSNDTLHFKVQTHPTDTGRLVGSGGRTVHALRIVLNASAMRLGRELALDVISTEPTLN